MSEVKRYVEGLTGMTERKDPRYEGDRVYVLADDYDALRERIERLEGALKEANRALRNWDNDGADDGRYVWEAWDIVRAALEAKS